MLLSNLHVVLKTTGEKVTAPNLFSTVYDKYFIFLSSKREFLRFQSRPSTVDCVEAQNTFRMITYMYMDFANAHTRKRLKQDRYGINISFMKIMYYRKNCNSLVTPNQTLIKRG